MFSPTPQITLRGLVLPVGGIRDKVLAARRGGIQTVVLPARNRRDLDDLPSEAAQGLSFTFVDTIADAIFALFPPPPRVAERHGADADADADAEEAAGARGRGGRRVNNNGGIHHPGHVSQQCHRPSRGAGGVRDGGKGLWGGGETQAEGEDVSGELLLESFL